MITLQFPAVLRPRGGEPTPDSLLSHNGRGTESVYRPPKEAFVAQDVLGGQSAPVPSAPPYTVGAVNLPAFATIIAMIAPMKIVPQKSGIAPKFSPRSGPPSAVGFQ